MKISLSLQIAGELVDYCLLGTEEPSFVVWKKTDDEPSGEGFGLEIKTDKDMKTIECIRVGNEIETHETDIKDIFLEALFAASIVQHTDEADGFEHTHDTHDNILSKENNPYDPKLIRVDPRQLSVEYVCGLIAREKLDLSPDFQREFVWTEITRKSRLIESIMLRIPLPVFYLSQDDEGKFQVVDGIQRLTVISEFVNNKFKLKNLEYLKNLEGKWFRADGKPDKSLPGMYAERIEQTQLFFNIIDPLTPEQVKYDIFRRINTGGKALNAQEIRNCLSSPRTREILQEMVMLTSFIKATRGSIRRTRMADRDIAMRFIGFYLLDNKKISIEYKGNMDEFLDLVTGYLNKNLKETLYRNIVAAFDTAMTNAYTLFGDKAFRKSSFINKALFLSWSRQLYKVDSDKLRSIPSVASRAQGAHDRRINTSAGYYNAISTGTNDVENIKTAYAVAKEVLEELMP